MKKFNCYLNSGEYRMLTILEAEASNLDAFKEMVEKEINESFGSWHISEENPNFDEYDGLALWLEITDSNGNRLCCTGVLSYPSHDNTLEGIYGGYYISLYVDEDYWEM